MKNDKKKTKTFERPVADVIVFKSDDIITISGDPNDKDDMDD